MDEDHVLVADQDRGLRQEPRHPAVQAGVVGGTVDDLDLPVPDQPDEVPHDANAQPLAPMPQDDDLESGCRNLPPDGTVVLQRASDGPETMRVQAAEEVQYALLNTSLIETDDHAEDVNGPHRPLPPDPGRSSPPRTPRPLGWHPGSRSASRRGTPTCRRGHTTSPAG